MENTRHERAIVVIASYVIGFTSAFIAFALHESASVVTQVAPTSAAPQERVAGMSAHTASIHFENDGLAVTTAEGERLLSARKNSPLVASVIQTTATPGFAEKIIEAELSRDSRYVYFCELLMADAETCDAYIYDIKNDLIYPVEHNGEHLSPLIADHNSYWLESDLLQIDGLQSVATETPWFVR